MESRGWEKQDRRITVCCYRRKKLKIIEKSSFAVFCFSSIDVINNQFPQCTFNKYLQPIDHSFYSLFTLANGRCPLERKTQL
jgi:hypothetical protein